MPLLITIRAARSDRRVALNELHEDHPGGAAWVCGDGRAHTVALTREVARRISDGSLDLVEAVEEEGGAPLELGEQLAPLGYAPDSVALATEEAASARTPRGKKA